MKRVHPLIAILYAALILTETFFVWIQAVYADQLNIAQGKPTTVSSVQDASYPASYATDGNTFTRWSSLYSQPQSITIDLGVTTSLSRIKLTWESASGKAFTLMASDDLNTWTTLYTTTTNSALINDIPVTGSGRYVRLLGIDRNTPYGFSLWEFEVYSASWVYKAPSCKIAVTEVYWNWSVIRPIFAGFCRTPRGIQVNLRLYNFFAKDPTPPDTANLTPDQIAALDKALTTRDLTPQELADARAFAAAKGLKAITAADEPAYLATAAHTKGAAKGRVAKGVSCDIKDSLVTVTNGVEKETDYFLVNGVYAICKLVGAYSR